jgi:hypothetical protein
MTDIEPLESILGSGAGGPLTAPTPWLQYTGYIQYAGGVVVGGPTGGNQGNGTINAAAVYSNGTQILPNNYLKLAGGIMTGMLTLFANPANPLDASTKQYSDTKVPLAGGIMTGPLTLSADPTANLGASTKQYVDNKTALYLPLTGGTLTGPLVLPADPTTVLQAATKQYVDNQVSGTVTGYLPLTGGTLTGPLVLPADPTTVLQAATKQYVDGKIGFAFADAPSDGTTYARNNAAWTNVIDAGAY